MPVIDPRTGLDVDLPWHAGLLAEILENNRLRQTLVMRCRATFEGIARMRRLLDHAMPRLGQGHDKQWWHTFEQHVQIQLAEALEDKKVRQAIAMHLAWARGAPFKGVLREMLELRTQLAARRELLKAGARAGLVLIEN